MAETVAECDRMIARAREKGLVLSCPINHSARFDPVVLQADEMVRSGRDRGRAGGSLHPQFGLSAVRGRAAASAVPAGFYRFRDLGVHGLYLLELFLGPVKKLEVTWRGSGRDPMLGARRVAANAESDKGSGYMFLSWNTRPIQNELWIHGTKGVIHVDCFLQTCELSKVLPGPKQIGFVVWGRSTRRSGCGTCRGIWCGSSRFAEAFAGNLSRGAGLLSRAGAGKPAPVSPEEGRRMIAMVEEAVAPADREVEAKQAAVAAEVPPPARILVTEGTGSSAENWYGVCGRRANWSGCCCGDRRRRGNPTHPDSPGAPVSFVYGSLGQPDVVDRAVAGVELVYHVGAAMKGGAAAFEDATVWGTRNIVGIVPAAQGGAPGICEFAERAGSCGHKTGDPVTEKSPLEPEPLNRGTYTRTKLEAENMVLAAIRDKGLPAVIIRPGQIFGPGAEKVTPNGVIQMRANGRGGVGGQTDSAGVPGRRG